VLFTRPDIAYVVQQVCLHMHDPWEPQMTALKRIIRYLYGIVDHGLLLHRSSSITELVVYIDADWAGCPDTRRSTSGYAVFLSGNLVSWSSKHQNVVSRSSVEVEYRAVANGVAKASWLRQLLLELRRPLQRSSLVYCNNISVVYLSTNPVQHHHTKHVEIDLHFALVGTSPPFKGAVLSIVTTSALSIYPPIRFNITIRSMLKLISTLFENGLLLVMSEFYMFQPRLSLLTSSRKGFRHQCFLSSSPRLDVLTRGGGGGGGVRIFPYICTFLYLGCLPSSSCVRTGMDTWSGLAGCAVLYGT
jgi:hypothetical protein